MNKLLSGIFLLILGAVATLYMIIMAWITRAQGQTIGQAFRAYADVHRVFYIAPALAIIGIGIVLYQSSKR